MSSSFYRDFSRRDLLKIGLASAAGVSYSGWLPNLARAAADQNKPRACIVLWIWPVVTRAIARQDVATQND